MAHTTIMRWVQRYAPGFEERWRRFARAVGQSWRVDETPIAAPLLIAQAERDAIVPRTVQDRFVAAQCARGQAIGYRGYAERDHLSLLAAASPLPDELVAWTRERLAGVPTPAGCRPMPPA
jgi:alpha-beta hydrolase superfamily lysophospholipase